MSLQKVPETQPRRRPATLGATGLMPDIEARDPFFRWMVHLGVPLIISLALHTGLLTVLAMNFGRLASRAAPVDEYEARIRPTDPAEEQGFQWPTAAPVVQPTDTALDWPDNLSMLRALPEPTIQDQPTGDGWDLGGFGVGELGRSGVIGTGSGAGEGGGGGFGAGFGSRPGVGAAEVWRVRASGTRFVYVVDYSGSILVAQDELKHELKRSIGELAPGMSFNVVLFQGRRDKAVTDSFAPALQPANPENKKSFFEWLDRKAPEGGTEPLPALRRALQMQPDAIFFFSDGYFDDNVVTEMARQNRGGRVQIHCLVFDEIMLQDTSGMPRQTDGSRRLQRIAEQNRGKAKIVTGLDVRSR